MLCYANARLFDFLPARLLFHCLFFNPSFFTVSRKSRPHSFRLCRSRRRSKNRAGASRGKLHLSPRVFVIVGRRRDERESGPVIRHTRSAKAVMYLPPTTNGLCHWLSGRGRSKGTNHIWRYMRDEAGSPLSSGHGYRGVVVGHWPNAIVAASHVPRVQSAFALNQNLRSLDMIFFIFFFLPDVIPVSVFDSKQPPYCRVSTEF